MIKLICFDLDGVLADLCETHKVSLNLAIENVAGKEFVISDNEHYSLYNGLSTKTKLNLLIKNKNLPERLVNEISEAKQKYTVDAIENVLSNNENLLNDLLKLKSENITLACVSNAIIKTVDLALYKLGIHYCFTYILGNESVKRQKPYPDLYQQAMIYAGVDKKETLIVEDSETGIQAAIASEAYVLRVSSDTKETNYKNIKEKLNSII